MRHRQPIRLLWWFLPLWFAFVIWNYLRQWVWFTKTNPPSPGDCRAEILKSGVKAKVCSAAPLSFEWLLVTLLVLLCIHLLLYWILLSFPLRRPLKLLLLGLQAALVLFTSEVLRSTLVTIPPLSDVVLGLSIPLIAANFDLFKSVRTALLANGGYSLLVGYYSFHVDTQIQYLWNKETVYGFLNILVLASAILYLQTEHAHERTQKLLRELDAAHSQLSAYALRVEELTILTERQRLARDLHDTLSQGLAGLVMQLDAANSYFLKEQPARAQEVIEQAMNRARTALMETRYVIHDLRSGPPRPDDLPELIQEEAERFTNATGIPCELELEALHEVQPQATEHVLRAITEGLTNIARHACASQVEIRAFVEKARLQIEICDNGIGLEPARVETLPGHYGLIGIRERVRLLDGHFEIVSTPGQGACLRVTIPINHIRSFA
jgi:NarL family two-component system sensor histidine kinase YdfH